MTETFLCGSHRDTLWEKSYMLVGMADLMCFFRTEPNAVRELLHRIMDWQLGIARHYLRLGVEMVSCGDDLGTQSSLLLSSSTVTEYFVPEYCRLFQLYRQHRVAHLQHRSIVKAALVAVKAIAERTVVATYWTADELQAMLQSGGFTIVTLEPGPPIVVIAERAAY